MISIYTQYLPRSADLDPLPRPVYFFAIPRPVEKTFPVHPWRKYVTRWAGAYRIKCSKRGEGESHFFNSVEKCNVFSHRTNSVSNNPSWISWHKLFHITFREKVWMFFKWNNWNLTFFPKSSYLVTQFSPTGPVSVLHLESEHSGSATWRHRTSKGKWDIFGFWPMKTYVWLCYFSVSQKRWKTEFLSQES